ncbi:hypothetical protein [Desulfospira joergensenii]|uniref:hypothetical protein n=1 Tax=Desulfospira joergensenii TaxID=53329 RepID=UPI000480B263|nr:hypothetical protein [Desulfospira joergensenii]
MKKLAVAIFVALLGLAFTAPAFALENQFGGYWRVRMFNQTDFDGRDNQDGISTAATTGHIETDSTDPAYGTMVLDDPTVTNADAQKVDTRTRLYYTAVINDNLKFVNKFEMDAVWGDSTTYGDIGADAVSVEVKNSYVDFNYAGANFKIGTQGGTLHRGFLFADDFSGITASMNGFTFVYAKVIETGDGPGEETQMYSGIYGFDLDGVKIAPAFTYVDEANGDEAWYLGVDVDAMLGGASVWGTLIYNGGERGTADIEAWLTAAGFSMSMNDMVGIHGQAFYATGEDADTDINGFQDATTGASYYWAEIMGYGEFDTQVSAGIPVDGDIISGIYAINFGMTYAASDKLKFTGDLWYAALTEDDANGQDDLGVEVDLVADYALVEGMNVKLIAAYLFAGDATTGGGSNDENPMEIGTMFSISF